MIERDPASLRLVKPIAHQNTPTHGNPHDVISMYVGTVTWSAAGGAGRPQPTPHRAPSADTHDPLADKKTIIRAPEIPRDLFVDKHRF